MSPRKETGSGRGAARLPWWAVVSATLGFVVLLTLVAAPAHADTPPAAGPLAALAGFLPKLLPQLLVYLW